MTDHLRRARLLLEHDRHEMAEREVRQALANVPDDAEAHALLALCLLEQKKFNEALREARVAIAHAPDWGFVYFVLARVHEEQHHFVDAEKAIGEAIGLDPENPDYFATLASLHLQQSRWKEALVSADRGLQFDAEHAGCVNVRAVALVKLGRRAEAGAAIGAVLQREPENAVTHANQGWALLHAGDHRRAMEHFREALRLEPEMEWARRGIVEALKARFFVYRIMLAYFLWMSRLSSRTQWMLVIGGVLGVRMLQSAARAQPVLAPFVWPIVIAYTIFVLMSWVAEPFFNLMLRLDSFGKHALSRDERRGAEVLGICWGLAFASIATLAIVGLFAALIGAAVFAILGLPASTVFRCSPGWPRWTMLLYASALLVVGVLAYATCIPQWLPADMTKDQQLDRFSSLFGTFFLGAVVSTWVGAALVAHRPKPRGID